MNILRKAITLFLMAAMGVGAAGAQGFAIGPQPVSEVTGSVSDASKAELMSRVKRWVALTFDRSDVIDLADPAAGTVVLKWSVPLQQPSQWLAATLSETCVIDMRDDGKWRLQVYSPHISWTATEAASALDELGLTNSEAQADGRLIAGIAKQAFDGSMDWPVGERLDTVANTYLEYLNSIQQFRNDRDKERGRATDEYRSAERQWRIVNDPRRAAATYNATLAQSLATALATSSTL